MTYRCGRQEGHVGPCGDFEGAFADPPDAEARITEVVKNMASMPPMTNKQLRSRVRRNRLLRKILDAEVNYLIALCDGMANEDDDILSDQLTDELIARWYDPNTIDAFKAVCAEVLHLRKLLGRNVIDRGVSDENTS
jgi:hypothetical protein